LVIETIVYRLCLCPIFVPGTFCMTPNPQSHPGTPLAVHRIGRAVSPLAACTTYFLSLAAIWSYTLDVIISCVGDSFLAWVEK
jgi:hypothetical protein